MAYSTTTSTTINNDIDVIDLSVLRRKRFRIDLGDGDTSRILELNVTDMGVIKRLSDGYSKLVELDARTTELGSISASVKDDEDDATMHERFKAFSDKLTKIDHEMRSIIDTIFDSNVCEVCCPSGSLYDPVNGRMRYEYIIDALMQLYSDSISEEMKKTTSRIKSHTAKYTGKK